MKKVGNGPVFCVTVSGRRQKKVEEAEIIVAGTSLEHELLGSVSLVLHKAQHESISLKERSVCICSLSVKKIHYFMCMICVWLQGIYIP